MRNPDVEHAPITLTLSADEALVLFELLARADDAGLLSGLEVAEERVLWRVEGQLEKVLVAPLRPDYDEVVAAARARVLDLQR